MRCVFFSIAQTVSFLEQPEQTNLFYIYIEYYNFTLYKIGEVLFRFIS